MNGKEKPKFQKRKWVSVSWEQVGSLVWEDTCGDDVDALLLPRDHGLRSARGLTGQHNGIVHDDIQCPWLGLDNGWLCERKERGKSTVFKARRIQKSTKIVQPEQAAAAMLAARPALLISLQLTLHVQSDMPVGRARGVPGHAGVPAPMGQLGRGDLHSSWGRESTTTCTASSRHRCSLTASLSSFQAIREGIFGGLFAFL